MTTSDARRTATSRGLAGQALDVPVDLLALLEERRAPVHVGPEQIDGAPLHPVEQHVEGGAAAVLREVALDLVARARAAVVGVAGDVGGEVRVEAALGPDAVQRRL